MNSFIVTLRRSSGIDCGTRPLVGRVNKAGIVGPAVRIDEIDEPALARLSAKNAIRGRESFESGSPNVESDEVMSDRCHLRTTDRSRHEPVRKAR